jgi:hypothetical protein
MSARLILRRLRAIRSRGDAGVTLSELIVSMGLFSLIGALTLGIFLSINTSSAATVDRTINSSSARNAIQSWSAYLRVADGTTPGVKLNRIEWLAPNDMLFYADLYNRSIDTPGATAAATMIWLRLDGAGSLVEEQFASTAASGATPKICRTLARNVTTPATLKPGDRSAQTLFTAYDQHGSTITNDSGQLGTAPAKTTGCQRLPVTVPSQLRSPDLTVQGALQNVNSVALDFVISDSAKKHFLEFSSRVVLPTLGGS